MNRIIHTLLRYVGLLALMIGLLSACTTSAPPSAVGGSTLAVSDVWMRMPVPGADTSAIYMVIRNTGDTDDALISVSSNIAARAEMHMTTHTDGVMAMRPVETITIPAHNSVSLEPGNYHIMVMGRTREVQLGEHISVQLQFQRAGSVTVEAEVRDRAPEHGGHS